MNILSKRIDQRLEAAEAAGEQNDDRNKKGSKLRHRDFIEEKVFEYLQTTACAHVDFQQMPVFISKLKGEYRHTSKEETTAQAEKEAESSADPNENEEGYNLTDAELLQVLNHMPTEPVEIHLMIEELSSRMDEDRQNDLLQLISEYAGVAMDAAEEEEVVEEEL